MGNLLGSFFLLFFINPPFFIVYAFFLSIFMLVEKMRVVTLPRRLIHGYFRFFGQILEQSQEIMSQMTAKHEEQG